ncbi:SMI1/KNR4 family protein [Deminuibacter soli]|uniref:SMI1/KNR4 family protein n=1 Tax=Deminuibacter soli TaxID=2291815 RepID=A0A3E1NJ25_9BACT|nr:SMI1/KNR4 family protein [Deminuibacter soli]RFM27922.1 SMI1/KNR4 family protein [Deminuibacter soli]
MHTFKEVLDILYKSGNLLKPCKEREVKRVEEEYGVRLPSVYIEFLSNMGKGAGDFMLGSSCFYDEIFSLKDWAVELLEENGFRSLPENSFVFWMHQGYQFAFFMLDEGDNPQVFFYTEVNSNNNTPDFILQAESLADFFYEELKMSGIIE